jgi:SAM-dependent methyltransferase
LLDEYSHIPKDDVYDHISAIVSNYKLLCSRSSPHISQRDDAWNHYPYPSIGLFIFCDLALCGEDLLEEIMGMTQKFQACYQTVFCKVRSGGLFLDVGCMFAQDARKLVHDGAPPSSIYGTDLYSEYFDYGYKLFRDSDIMPRSHFIAADILDANAPGLKEL